MRSSLPSSFAKVCLIFCLAILAVSSAVGQTAAGFTQSPDHVSASPQGCRNNGGLTLQQSGTTFICTPDTTPPSDPPYTGGDLGKSWAELDFVPFKLTTSRAGNSATPTFNVIIAGDYQQGGSTGYDFITVPIVDPNLPSDPSCSVVDANAGDVHSGLEVATGVTGGTNTTIYRTLTISQPLGSTCYFAYDQRLAIGSHLFNGSNLQAYAFLSADFKTGKQTIPIPVNSCNSGNTGCQPSPQPQSIDKTMSATAGQSINWSLNGSGPDNISSDTCDSTQLTKSGLKFTISWSAVTTSTGGVTIVTKVFATNPALVPVQVQITDRIYPGIDPAQDNDPFINPPGPNGAIDTDSGGFVTVPANTKNQLVLTHTYADPSGGVGTGYNDIAIGSYEDADGNQVAGNTFAQANATAISGTANNTTATVNNLESITGTGLNFSTDSFTPSTLNANGAFDTGYSAGTKVPLAFANPVSWTSISQNATTVESDGGESVLFSKSVYLPAATAVLGTLTDSATLTDSTSNTVNMSPSLDVNVTGAPLVSLKIVKNTNVALGTDQTFNFTLTDSHGNPTPASVTVLAGATTGNTTVNGLTPDNYTVTETADPLWANDGPHSINLSPNPTTGAVTCTGSSVTFNNTLQEGHIIVKKVTVPTGSSQSFTFTPSYNSGTTFNLTDGGSNDSGLIAAGGYSVSEGATTGWDLTSATCDDGDKPSAITLAAGATVTCTFINSRKPELIVIKHVINNNGGNAVAADFTMTVTATNPTPASFAGVESPGTNVTLDPGSYGVTEGGPSGYTESDSTDCKGTVAYGDIKTCTITNDDKQAYVIVNKVVNNNYGGTAKPDDFKLTLDGTATTSGTKVAVNPGSHTAGETLLSGYKFVGYTVDCDSTGKVTVALGQTKTCTLTNNDLPGTIIIKKIAKPTGTGSFGFTTTGTGYNGFSLVGGGQNSQTLNPGTYTVKEGTQLGWILTGIGMDPSDPNNPLACSVTGTGGSSGSGNLSTQTATITLKAGDTVTCVFENTGSGATRTQGFWATHTPLANIAWFGGTAFGHTFPGVTGTAGIGNTTLCGRPIDTLGKLMGGFWSGISTTSTGKKRSSLDQARMQILQQLLAAELNASAFGSVPSGGSGQFGAWESAYCGTNQSAISTAQQQAGSFNSQGDNSNFTPGTSADSKNARAIANYSFWDTLP